MAQYFNPLLCGDFYRAFNFLELPPQPTPTEVWRAASAVTLYFSSFCKDEGLPIDAVCFSLESEKHAIATKKLH